MLSIASASEADDAALTLMINAASALVIRHCNLKIERSNYVEYYSGTGFQKLVLRQTPVVQVNHVWLNNVSGNWGTGSDPFPSSTELTQGVHYWLKDEDSDGTGSDCGILVSSTYWPDNLIRSRDKVQLEYLNGLGNIKVDYDAGYLAASIPANIKMAVIMQLQYWRRSIRFGEAPLSEKLGYWEVKFRDAKKHSGFGLCDEALNLLIHDRDIPI